MLWERLIRVLGHEINNSLTPIKSIAGTLRSRLSSELDNDEQDDDFARGLEVIEDRAESLNRFLQAYRELMGLPAPRLEPVSLAALARRVAKLETRLNVSVTGRLDVTLLVDPDQLTQALINLVRNAAEASLSPDAAAIRNERSGSLAVLECATTECGNYLGDVDHDEIRHDIRTGQWPWPDKSGQSLCSVLYDQARRHWNRIGPGSTNRIGSCGIGSTCQSERRARV